MGVAFHGLDKISADLYPVVGSTAKCTRMRLENSFCGNMTLKERASFVLVKNSRNRVQLLNQAISEYQLPNQLVLHLAKCALNCHNQAQIKQQRNLPEEHRSMINDNYDDLYPLQENENLEQHDYENLQTSDTNLIARNTKHLRQRQRQQQQQQQAITFMSYNQSTTYERNL